MLLKFSISIKYCKHIFSPPWLLTILFYEMFYILYKQTLHIICLFEKEMKPKKKTKKNRKQKKNKNNVQAPKVKQIWLLDSRLPFTKFNSKKKEKNIDLLTFWILCRYLKLFFIILCTLENGKYITLSCIIENIIRQVLKKKNYTYCTYKITLISI